MLFVGKEGTNVYLRLVSLLSLLSVCTTVHSAIVQVSRNFSDEVMLTMTRHSVLLFFSERIINFPESPLLDLPPLQIITRKHRTEPKPSREDVSRTTMASS